MRIRNIFFPLLFAAVVVGCAPEASVRKGDDKAVSRPASRPASKPASRPTPETVSKPLAAITKWKFADLKPDVSKPVNKPWNRPLPPGGRDALEQGIKLRDEKDYPGAVDRLQRALGFDPENPETHRLLGLTYVAQRNLGKAIEHLGKAEAYFGDDIILQALIGRIHEVSRQPRDAIVCYRKALLCSNAGEKASKRGEVLLRLSRLLATSGYLTASLETYDRLDKLIEKHGSEIRASDTLMTVILQPEKLMKEKAVVLKGLQKNKEAASLLAKAWKRDRSDSVTARLLVDTLIELKEYQQCEKMILDIAGKKNHRGYLPNMVKKLCIRSKDKKAPGRIWEAYNEKYDVSPQMAVALSQAAIQIGAKKEARKILDRLLKEVPSSNEGIRMLAELTIEAGQYLSGLELLVGLVAKNPTAVEGVKSGIDKIVSSSPPADIYEKFSKNAYSDTSDRRYAVHYVAALLRACKGDYLKAADHFRRAIDEKQDFIPAYEAFFEIEHHLENREDIEAVLAMSRDLAGNHIFHYLRGKVELDNGRYLKAIEELDKARKNSPTHISTLLCLAEACEEGALRKQSIEERTKLYRKALDALSAALAADRFNIKAYTLLSDLTASMGRKDQLRELADKLQSQMPDKSEALILAVRNLFRAGDRQRADQMLSRLLQQYPENPDVKLLRITVDVNEGRIISKEAFEKSRKALDELIGSHPGFTDAGRILTMLLQKPVGGDFAEAEAVWKELCRQKPGDIKFAIGHINAMIKAEKYKEAADKTESLLKRSTKDPVYRRILIEILVKDKQFEKALAQLDQWIEEKDQMSNLWVNLYLDVCRDAKLSKKALEFLDKASSRDIEMPDARRDAYKLQFLCEDGRHDDAAALVNGTKEESLAFALRRSAIIRFDRDKKYKLALKMMDDLLKSNLLSEEGKKTMALWQLQLTMSAFIKLNEGSLKDIETAAEELLKKHPDQDDVPLLLLGAYQEKKEFDKGIARFNAWLKEATGGDSSKTESLPTIKTAIVSLYIAQGKLKDALKTIDQFIEEKPDNPEFHNLRATVLGEMGKEDDAIKALEKADKLKTGEPSYSNNLAYSLVVKGEQGERAEKLSRLAVAKTAPDTPTAYKDTLAWVLYRRGKVVPAANMFYLFLRFPEEGEELTASLNHPVLWDHAGDVFYRLGWTDQAVKYWTQAKDIAAEMKKKGETITREVRLVQESAGNKLKAVKKGREAEIAPVIEKEE